MVLLNCFGDEEETPGNEEEQELIVIGHITPDRLVSLEMKSISLVGSFISGHHQELRFLFKKMKQGGNNRTNTNNKDTSNKGETTTVFLRLSRTNGTDTFQIEDGETPEIFDGDLPVLMEVEKFPKPILLQHVKNAFDKSRDLIKRYDQGDCQILSQMIFEDLVPGSFPDLNDELVGW